MSVTHANGSLAFNVSNGADTTTAAGFAVAFSFSGTALWVIRVNGAGTDTIETVVEAASGNIYIMGGFYQSSPLYVYDRTGTQQTTIQLDVSQGDRFIIKHNSAGAFQWALRMSCGVGGSENVTGTISLDASENIYLAAGSQFTSVIFYNTTETMVKTLALSSAWDGYVAKWNSAGTLLWAAIVGGTGDDITHQGALDPTNSDFFIGGWVRDLYL
jgi:hypothetical protein